MSRNTQTGKVLEKLILPALKQGGYEVDEQAYSGERVGGGKHQVDSIAIKPDKKIFISLKWQQSGGTAEQKVPYEILCLAKAIKEDREKNPNKYIKAYLVLGGTDKKRAEGSSSKGWTLREFYIRGGLEPYLNPIYRDLVQIVKPEDFIALANKGDL